MKKYCEFLKEFYQTPYLWTVMHNEYYSIDDACGRPVAITNQETGVTFIRLFTEYKYAVDFCVSNPAYTYKGIPLIAKLKKADNYSSLFNIAPHMNISRICLDDTPNTQVFNFSLQDLIYTNEIDTRLSCLIPEGDEAPKHISFNTEWIDLFSVEMCNEFINPILASLFNESEDGVCTYLEHKAPFIYLLFTVHWIETLLSNPNWRQQNAESIPAGEHVFDKIKKIFINRLTKLTEPSDYLAMLMLGEDHRGYICGEETIGLAVNDIGLTSYTASIGKKQNCKVDTLEVNPGGFKNVVDMYAKTGAKQLRFLLPYNDNINVVVSIEEIYKAFNA